MTLSIYTSSRSAEIRLGEIDITPNTADPLGRVLGFSAILSSAPAALQAHYLDGTASTYELVALAALYSRSLIEQMALEGSGVRLLLATTVRLGNEVSFVCGCDAHGRGNCLRLAIANAVKSVLGDQARFCGERASGGGAPEGIGWMSAARDFSKLEWEDICRIATGAPPAPPAVSPPAASSSSDTRQPVPATLPYFAVDLGLDRWPVNAPSLTAARRASLRAAHPDSAANMAQENKGRAKRSIAEIQHAFELAEACLAFGLEQWPPTARQIEKIQGGIQAGRQLAPDLDLTKKMSAHYATLCRELEHTPLRSESVVDRARAVVNSVFRKS